MECTPLVSARLSTDVAPGCLRRWTPGARDAIAAQLSHQRPARDLQQLGGAALVAATASEDLDDSLSFPRLAVGG
jgi:hypothetical protein